MSKLQQKKRMLEGIVKRSRLPLWLIIFILLTFVSGILEIVVGIWLAIHGKMREFYIMMALSILDAALLMFVLLPVANEIQSAASLNKEYEDFQKENGKK